MKNEVLCSFEWAMQTKPVTEIISLQNVLYSSGVEIKLAVQEKLRLNDKELSVFIVSHGCFSAYRSSDDHHITTLFSPAVFGLVDAFSMYYNMMKDIGFYIKAETVCYGLIVPIHVLIEKCDEYHLWHDLTKIMAHRMMTMSVREDEFVGNNAYSKIRVLLMELRLYPENIRSQINIAEFIQNRTKLSRSRTMGILSRLKEKKYIGINAGKLTFIGLLPSVFL
jgi:CRP-like cAMP-binding protein